VKNNSAAILLVLMLSYYANGQKMAYDKNKLLELRLVQNITNVYSGSDGFEMDVEITNKSTDSFLLYGFKIIEPGNSSLSTFMQPEMVAGSALFVCNEKGMLAIASLQSPPDGVGELDPMDSARFVGGLLTAAGRFIDATKITLKKNESWRGNLHVKINQRKMVRGEYEVFLIYYCGINITNLIDAKRIHTEEIINHAILYQGYVKSNTTRLIIH
jgi:hypothetical protein